MPTGYTTVSASLLTANGAPVANATIYFSPVDNNGRALSALVDATYGVVTGPFSAQVVAGAFSISVPDTSLTSPVNIGYALTLIDNISGNPILLYGFGCYQPTGSTVNFDAAVPNLAAQVTVQTGPAGPPGAVGSTSGSGLSAITFVDAGDGTTRTLTISYGEVKITP